jgi:hypothetical protein
MSHVEVGYPPARNIVSPLHASIAILGCHPLYVRRLWLGKTTAKVGYGLSYVNTYYGLLDLHFGLIRWDFHEPNFIYQAHHLFPAETLSGLADPPTLQIKSGEINEAISNNLWSRLLYLDVGRSIYTYAE